LIVERGPATRKRKKAVGREEGPVFVDQDGLIFWEKKKRLEF